MILATRSQDLLLLLKKEKKHVFSPKIGLTTCYL